MELLGAKMMILRKQNGLTQDELAEKVGASQKTISSWETGRTYPRMRDITALCMALDCTIEELTGKKAREIVDISYDDVVLKFKDFSIEELERLRDTISEIIDNRIRIEKIEMERKEQDKRIMEYKKRIEELEKQLKGIKQ